MKLLGCCKCGPGCVWTSYMAGGELQHFPRGERFSEERLSFIRRARMLPQDACLLFSCQRMHL